MIVAVDKTNISQAAAVHSVSWQESHRAFCSPDFVEMHTPERQQRYLSRKMEKGSRLFLLLAGDTPAGIVSVTDSLIADLYILPDMQGRGYGTELLRFAVGECRDDPTLWILRNNERAGRLYRKEGFRETGRIRTGAAGIDEIEFTLSRGGRGGRNCEEETRQPPAPDGNAG